MKLRIKGNSIRLRLTRSEVAAVAAEGRLENRTDLGNRSFCYAVAASDSLSGLSACFDDACITVLAPKFSVAGWASSEEVGIYGEQMTSDGEVLSIAVEKDFRCLDRSRAEDDEADNYPHPALKPRAA